MSGDSGLLTDFIAKEGTEVLNADPETSLDSILAGGGLLKSAADAELLIKISFKGAVTLKAIRFAADSSQSNDEQSPPNGVKIYLNSPYMVFDDTSTSKPTVELELTESELSGEEIKLPLSKFSNCLSVTIFVENNQEDTDVSFLNCLQLIGTPKAGFNMNELKKVG